MRRKSPEKREVATPGSPSYTAGMIIVLCQGRALQAKAVDLYVGASTAPSALEDFSMSQKMASALSRASLSSASTNSRSITEALVSQASVVLLYNRWFERGVPSACGQ
jgi:hypothetical protein